MKGKEEMNMLDSNIKRVDFRKKNRSLNKDKLTFNKKLKN